jgi:hypothetical protein
VPFFFDMFNNVVTFLLALDCHFDQGSRLSHVGTEGSDRRQGLAVDGGGVTGRFRGRDGVTFLNNTAPSMAARL